MLVETAYVGAIGFDTDTKLSAQSAGALAASGYRFAVRYLSLGAPSHGDLDAAELQAIVPVLNLMAVQHVRAPGWMPSAALGKADGEHAALNAKAAGILAATSVWFDLEGVAGGATPAEVIAHADAWYNEVRAAGYLPGIYVGSGSVLSASDLYHKLGFSRYWKSFSRVPEPDVRGFTMIQLFDTITVEGVAIDVDVIQKDYEGGLPVWLTSVNRMTTLPSPDDTLTP